ncbi:hypothetical protein FACS1894188_02000 [Clostridia bacterium]|nr:hypothetical protein FACS1894188_02000 [Clostridia bacterium]
MSAETTALLRSLAYQAGMAETLDDLRAAIRAMCPETDFNAMQKLADEEKARKSKIE